MFTGYFGVSNAVVPAALPIIPGVALGFPNTVDYNPQKTLEAGVALAPVKGLTISVTDYRGTEGIRVLGGGGIDLKVNLLDAVVAYTLGDLSLAYNFDYNTSKNNDGTSNAKFLGHALYANYQITPKIRAGVRGELTSAWDSVAGGPKNKRNEVTLTGDYSAAKNFDLVSDVRYANVQNDAVFAAVTGGNPNGHQLSYVLKAVYKF
jgi:predicted porin